GVQATFVDLPSALMLSFPYVKLAFTAANLGLAGLAHRHMRKELRALLAGPQALPPKRRFFGLTRNPAYNRAVKQSTAPHTAEAWREKYLYRPAYFLNAGSMFMGSQFLWPADRLIFPASLLVSKTTALVTTGTMIFDVWRGVKSADDALRARERENAAFRKLQI
ncbi:MAG: hypothetical protein KGQ41_09240, partial [Alphaproteobacteria bacterium]|nr:hypothetical protein [Alphaproteobacteria bacterium]